MSTNQKMKTVVFATLGALAMAALSACDVTVASNPYATAWYDVYGRYCYTSGTPGPGCDFYWDGSKIVAGDDPYYYTSSVSFNTWYYVDAYGYSQYYTGWGWLSPDGILYTDQGYALNSDEDQGSKDLIGNAAEQEKSVTVNVGKNFAQKYALAEDAGIQIAKTLNEWATLSKKQNRARTASDVADFSKRLYGISVDKATTALAQAKSGDPSGLESANKDIATFWGTSPETSKVILKNWYKDQLSDFGVK